ncbi:MAG: hypothetical protein ACK5UG_12955 [Synechococcaceae cyanobacterium]|jgi:hypothetical protein
MDSRFVDRHPGGGLPAPFRAFTPAHSELLRRCWQELAMADGWHAALPVLLLERCWLRLERVDVQHLDRHLPPDRSQAAPELARFRDLTRAGMDPWSAQQTCWLEFGEEACQQAQTRFWCQLTAPQAGWTLERYLGLITDYRRRLSLEGPPAVPLIVRSRAGESSPPQILWLTETPRPMRHTCG